MTDDRRDLASFARAVEALAPYLEDLVFVGGWAHTLWLPKTSRDDGGRARVLSRAGAATSASEVRRGSKGSGLASGRSA
jgi:hypothetical protein